MAEVGLIPAAPAVAEADAPADEVTANEEEVVPAEPALDVTPPADLEPDTNVDQLVAATFGLLRAEPDGSVVIAGSGTPGSRVEVFANGNLLGTVEVEASGDWVFVPDTPLAPGGLEITLGEEGKPGTAEDSFIVVINEDKTSQPLVVASKPGEASKVLQGLTAPTQVAAAPEAETATEDATNAEPAGTATEPAQTAESVEAAAADDDGAPSVPAAEPAMEVAALPDAPSPESAAAVEPSASSAAPESAEPSQVQDTVEPEPAAAPAEPTPLANETESAAAMEVAAQPEAEPAVPAAEPVAAATPEPAESQVAAMPPTIDAIEIENDRAFFAGAGPEGGIIRLYVDDAFVADATVEEGRWLIEAGPVLDAPNQRVRADLLDPNSAAVVARAEVDFVVDVPGAETPVDIAQAPVTEPVDQQPAAAAPAQTDESSEPAEATEPVAENEPAATRDQPVAPQEGTTVEAAAQPETTPEVAEAVEPEPASSEPAEPASAEAAVPTMVAVSLGDPEAQRFASGKAIIRRGDNLWTIARRVYGEGLKYTTIYQANTGQIRDPDRIYPGQVFDLPQEALDP
ncbi:LysM peptidoglycan-binding domain-containing protein [Devosia sp. XK-2]|uniref:LysM peptidoglycan-binding domain-containing protein n=1 Tax=Devosia sp. XK-2 TaxID=3126689 RepID=UPI0030D21281